MSKRQLARLPISELERLFDEKRANDDFLKTLLVELSHRSTSRSRELNRRVRQALSLVTHQQPRESGAFPITPDQYRIAAEFLRRGDTQWTDEDRTVANDLADAHEAIADFVEREFGKRH
jgi:hypothetical protein